MHILSSFSAFHLNGYNRVRKTGGSGWLVNKSNFSGQKK